MQTKIPKFLVCIIFSRKYITKEIVTSVGCYITTDNHFVAFWLIHNAYNK